MAHTLSTVVAEALGPVSSAMKLIKTAKQMPLAEAAYLRMHEAIRDGVLKPGQRMMEQDLAKWLDMSRTPVRDALRRMETEGLLTHEPRLGLIITQYDRRAVVELYAIREVLEGTAAGFAARHATEFEMAELLQLATEQQGLKDDVKGIAENNRRFHRIIYQAAHNRFLVRSLDAVLVSMGLLWQGYANFMSENRVQASFREHSALAKAIASRNPEDADQAARAHMRGSLQERLKRLPSE